MVSLLNAALIHAYCNDTRTRLPGRPHGGCSGNVPRRRSLVPFQPERNVIIDLSVLHQIITHSRLASFYHVSLLTSSFSHPLSQTEPSRHPCSYHRHPP